MIRRLAVGPVALVGVLGLAGLLGLAGMLGAPAAAVAETTPSPDAVIQYTGTAVITDLTDGFTSTPAAAWTIDCSSTPCTIIGSLTDPDSGEVFPLTGGAAEPFVDGTGTYTYPASGSFCTDDYIGPHTIVITANPDGQLTASFDLPGAGDIDCPDFTVRYNPWRVEITSSVVSGDVCFVFATCTTAAAPSPSATAVPVSAASGGTTLSSPSVLGTLPTLASALSATNAAWAAAMSVVLVILVALPSHLFNTAMEQGSERISSWWRRIRPRPTSDAPPRARPRFTGWPFAAGGVLVASLISSFVDPSFGFTPASVRVFLSILVSFLVDAVIGWFVVIWLMRRAAPTASAAFRFVPATLLVVVAAVLFSRITGFQPGIVFGLVAGVVFGTTLATAEKARATLIPLAWSFGIALVGWLGYSLLVATSGPRPAAGVVFAEETLSAIAIAGISALPIALIPIQGLAGYDVFRWSRVGWAISYAIGLVGFFFVLMPTPISWQEVPLSIGVWVALYLIYAVLAVGVWLIVVRPWVRDPSKPEPA